MTADSGSQAAIDRLVDWLGQLGGRWGLPPDACRLHGWLYFTARPAPMGEIEAAVGLAPAEAQAALAWLEDHRLVERDAGGGWTTLDDPWELVMRSLEVRRERELGPALELLRSSRAEAATDRPLAARIDGLLALLDDIAALDAQARRFSPRTLRRLIGAGGFAARLVGGALGQRRGRG